MISEKKNKWGIIGNSIAKIYLTRNQMTFIDLDDINRILKYKWCALYNKSTKSYYAARASSRKKDINGKQHYIAMHREIINAKKGEEVDHKNHNTLWNLKSNLRICTHRQNTMNKGMPKNNSSTFKGVSWDKQVKKWRATIGVNYKTISLGRFKSKTDAAIAYNQAALKYYGKFSNINEVILW